jgi:predicted nucleic acid-binding protein
LRVLVDTNVVLDLLLDRKPFAEAATKVFSLVEQSRIEGFLCATTITTVDYLLGLSLDQEEAREALQKLLDLFEIAPVNRPVLEQALRSEIADFEDAVLEQAGLLVTADAIVTRNTKDFQKSKLTALDPEELIAAIPASAAEDKSGESDTK